MAVELHESFAIHPGPWLREQVIKPYGMTITSAAAHLQVTRAALTRVLDGNARLTPPHSTAVRKGIWDFGTNVASDAVVSRFGEGKAEGSFNQD